MFKRGLFSQTAADTPDLVKSVPSNSSDGNKKSSNIGEQNSAKDRTKDFDAKNVRVRAAD